MDAAADADADGLWGTFEAGDEEYGAEGIEEYCADGVEEEYCAEEEYAAVVNAAPTGSADT